MQQGEGERSGLSSAGGRLTDEVPALHQGRDRFALDRGGLFVTEGGQGFDELGSQLKGLERLRVHLPILAERRPGKVDLAGCAVRFLSRLAGVYSAVMPEERCCP